MNDLFLLEIEDARALIEETCGDSNAFDFEMQKTPSVFDDRAAPRFTVTVSVRGKRVQYQGGYGQDWVNAFELDLCRGLFGPLLKMGD